MITHSPNLGAVFMSGGRPADFVALFKPDNVSYTEMQLA